MRPHGVMTKVLDCSLKVNLFELQSYYYINIQANTFKKGMNLLIPLSYGLNSVTAIFLQGWPKQWYSG